MISPDAQSDSDISDSLPPANNPEKTQERLPGIHSLFPELSERWSMDGSPEPFKSPIEVERRLRGDVREIPSFNSLYQAAQKINVDHDHYLASLHPDTARSPPMLPALRNVRPTVSPIPTYAEYRSTQLRRPRSSPVSPSEDRARMQEDYSPRRRRPSWEGPTTSDPHHYSIPSLDDTRPPTASSSVQSTPPHIYTALSNSSSSRARRAGSISIDTVPLTNRASSSRYQCTYCAKRFSRPSSLKIHENSHTGAKPFQCPEPGCGRNFSVMSNMRRHQKTHKVDTPPQAFAQLQNSGPSFSETDSRHPRNHPSSSDHCGSELTQRIQSEQPPFARSKPRSYTSPT